MGKRSEPRKEVRVPVRIFGTDSGGQIFSERVFTVNVSRRGVELSGVQAQPNIDEIVGLTYGSTKSHFRVRWVGQPGTPKLGHIGLLNLSPEKALWDFPLPGPAVDTTVGKTHERREHPRVRSGGSVEVHLPNQDAPIRARIGDISIGGCFIDMPISDNVGYVKHVLRTRRHALNEERHFALVDGLRFQPGLASNR